MSNDEQEKHIQRTAAAINRHGYPFQNRVIRELHQLQESKTSPWVFEAAEFPAAVGDQGTRIDFILTAQPRPYWLLAECKRVNPSMSEWLFLSTPYIRRNHEERFIAEKVELNLSVKSGGVGIIHPDPRLMFHMALAVKTDIDGESGPSGRDAIEEAATQVCRGMNGVVTLLNERSDLFGITRNRTLLPVIFTTAKLYTCDLETDDVDLSTGKVPNETLKLKEQPFVYYQYHLSPGIKHRVDPRNISDELSRLLASEYIRTIPIVTATGIKEFIRQFHPANFTECSL
jgi:hypothetical protein